MNDPRASDLHQALVALLADGRWHDYHTILAKAAKTVQPGAAIRACEASRARRSGARHGEAKARMKPLTTDEQIRAGSRQLAQSRMLNKAFEIDPPGVVPPGTRKRIRLRPKRTEKLVRRRPQLVLAAPTPDNPEALQVLADPRRSPHTQAVLDLLQDGAWHPLEQALAAGMATVTDARALHHVAQTRANGGNSAKAQAVSRAQSIRTGARSLVYQAVASNSLLEMTGAGDSRQVRIRRPS
jgi:hypothetical protein